MTPKEFDPVTWRSVFLSTLQGTAAANWDDGGNDPSLPADMITGHAWDIADHAVICLSGREWSQGSDGSWFMIQKQAAQ